MTETRDKLQESRYFLERMTLAQAESDAFRYNLSAFLSASRSVTLIMQKEYDKIPGFKQWWSEKQEQVRTDDAMRLLNEKRVMTIHQQSVRPRGHVDITIEERITIGDSVSVILTHADDTVERREPEPITPPVATETGSRIEWRWYFDELPEKDVLALCKEHIPKLDALVEECESRFTL